MDGLRQVQVTVIVSVLSNNAVFIASLSAKRQNVMMSSTHIFINLSVVSLELYWKYVYMYAASAFHRVYFCGPA